MAANINRVVLVGNLTRDPEVRQTPSGTPVCSLRIAVNTRRARRSGQWTDKPNYFERLRLRQPGGELRAVPVEGPPGRRSTAAWTGASGRPRTARSAKPSRSSPNPCSSSARAATASGGGGGNQFVPAGATRAAATPTSGRRRRHPVLRREALPSPKNDRSSSTQAEARARRPGRAAGRAASSASRRSTRSTTRTSTSSGATCPRRARSATAGSAAPAGATSARSRSRSSVRVSWRSSRTSETSSAAMEVILIEDVDTLGLRGDVVNVARGYARNFLLPRGLAEVATPGAVAELERASPAGAARGEHVDEAQRDRRAARARLELRFDVPPGRPARCSARSRATNVADRALGAGEAPGRPPQAADGRRSSGSAATRCRSRSSGRRRRAEVSSSPPRARSCRPRRSWPRSRPSEAAEAARPPRRSRREAESQREDRGRARRERDELPAGGGRESGAQRSRATSARTAGSTPRPAPRARTTVRPQASPPAWGQRSHRLSTGCARPVDYRAELPAKTVRFRPLPRREHTFYTPCTSTSEPLHRLSTPFRPREGQLTPPPMAMPAQARLGTPRSRLRTSTRRNPCSGR